MFADQQDTKVSRIFSERLWQNGLIVLAASLLAACAQLGTRPGDVDIARLIAQADRATADTDRDVGRRPAEVLDFLGLKPGMQVIDLIASSGYYSEVMAARSAP